MKHLLTCTCITLTVLACFISSSGFLLEGDCLLGPPCECVYNTITCSRRNLSTIPTFTAAKRHYNTIAFSFNFNQLTNVPARIFADLGSTGAVSIDIKLAWNQITNVDDNAFEGIENSISLLDLSDNKLSGLPSAIGKLSSLRTLLIDGNPLSTLSDTVMKSIRNSLSTFSVSLTAFQTWPTQMGNLRSLKSLSVLGLGALDIPLTSFTGSTSTLQTLTLQDTMLVNTPSAICGLQNLRTFNFISNHNINKSSPYPCEMGGTIPRGVTTLKFADDDIDAIPDVFTVFPSITRLSFINNQITTIMDTNSFDGNKVTEFDLTNNSLSTVPAPLIRFKKLAILRLDHNLINSIGANDFSELTSLRLLYLTNNPLQTIDPQAFKNNGQMTILDLTATQLTSFPSAVTSLPRLSIFHVTGGMFECSCTDMVSVKTWNVTLIHSDIGPCKKLTDSIKDFISIGLKKC